MAVCGYCCFFLCCAFVAEGLRYGSQSDTIHVSADLRDTELKNSPRIVAYKEWSDGTFSGNPYTPGLDAAVAEEEEDKEEVTLQKQVFKRLRRQASPTPTANQQISKSVVNLNDSHFQLVIHWAGEGSDVIVALSRDISPGPGSVSHVYISRDYGKTFTENKLLLNVTTPGIIDIYYNSPVYNSHYIFVDVIHNAIWTTIDSGLNVQLYHLSFTPRQLTMHPTDWRVVAGFDEKDPEKRLWLSGDFGATWQVLHTSVKAFYWGIVPYDAASTIYLQTEVPSVVLRYTGSMANYLAMELFRDVVDFEVIDRFMFVTRNVSLLGSRPSYHLQLWISQNRGRFQQATFPNNDLHQDFFIADATENQVFLCANHNLTSTNLYISDATGLRYSLSLQNIVYFNPRKNFRLQNVISRPFADIHKVNGLDGVYIATQARSIADISPFNDNNQISLITFNKGGYWHPIPAPETDVQGNRHCNMSSIYQETSNCSLHLVQRFHSLFSLSRIAPILSKKSAVGLLLATGNVGTAIGSRYNVYMSNDGGLVWKEILEGAHFYAMGDHGGLVVAIRLAEVTGDILYSFDEGESWFSFKFSEVKLRIYGLLTEPGEKTTVFSIFGSLFNGSHSWVVVQVNLTAILGKPCEEDDYKQWSPTDSPKVDCLLGRKTVYERRRPHSLCFNGRDYEREISVENCPCSIQDFECDVGFREISFAAVACEYDIESGINVYRPPFVCPEGSFYNRTKGYRRVVGDVCVGGVAEFYEPDVLPCPIQGQEEFLLFTNHTNIHRYVFDHQRHEILPIGNLENVLTVEYDYRNDCLFWSDARLSNIQMLCLRGENVTQKVIVSENMDTIEGLAYNWMSHQIFWIDAGHRRIEVARVDGTHRKVLINSTLNSPRAIIVSPRTGYMFWTDWSSTNPRISRSYMDGSNIQPILTGSNQVHWPNGLAIDDEASLLYFTDAFLDWIGHCNLDGSGFKVIIRNHPLVQHPYSLGIFKEEIYWTDWSIKAVLRANKVTGHGVQKVIANISGILDLKVLHRTSQQGHSACSDNNGQCQSLCFEKPPVGSSTGSSRTCSCSDMYIESVTNNGTQCLCADGKIVPSSGICSTAGPNATCAFHQFTCSNGRCIPVIFKCDGDNDCGDFSDEIHCSAVTCLPSQFQCRSGRCIPGTWKCDHDNDCGDMSDEPTHCTYASCSSDQFQCDNGRCVARRWLCDRDDDCHDGSDERNCNQTRHLSCATVEFQCHSTGVCISRAWTCDGDLDCSDGSDELAISCGNRTTHTSCATDEYRCMDGSCIPLYWKCDGIVNCDQGEDEQSCSTTRSPWPVSTGRPGQCLPLEFACVSGNWCIAFHQVCDGIQDCVDNSDETLCHSCTRPNQFQCQNGRCISRYMVCDARDDCGDSSDEVDCVSYSTTLAAERCPDRFYSCEGGGCVYESWVCDGEPDCIKGDDEINCQNATNRCHPSYFSCILTTGCIPISFVCDGERDCLDGSDEIDCDNGTQWSSPPPPSPVSCPPSLFSCDFGDCIKWKFRCDGHWDCPNGADERDCDAPGHRAIFFLPKTGTTADQIIVKIENIVPSVMANSTVELRCILSDGDAIYLKTVKLMPFPVEIKFGNLSADTEYEVRVVVVANGQDGLMSPAMTTKTLPLAPSPPQNVFGLVEMIDNQLILNISWTKPVQRNGRLVEYRIKCEDLTGGDGIQQISAKVPASATSYIFTMSELMLGHKYRFQVSASNGRESNFSSPPLNISFALKAGCVNVQSADSGPRIDGILVNLEAHTAHEGYGKSIVISWCYAGESPGDVLFYRVLLWAKDILDNLTLSERASDVRCTQDHQTCKAQVNGLNPATEYNIRVTAQGKDQDIGMCSIAQPLIIRTQGNRPNPPRISISSGSSGTVILNYTFDTNVDLTDGLMRVFYESLQGISNKNDMDLNSTNFADSRFSPADQANGKLMEISNLTACTFYCFTAQIQWPARSGLSQTVCLLTSYDKLAPPRDLLVKEVGHSEQFVDVTLFWSPPCRPTAMKYIVEVAEADKIPKSFLIEDGGNYTIASTVRDLKRGATYHFRVRRSVPNARSTPVVSKTMRMYPAPRQFKVISELYESTKLLFILTWERPSELPNNGTIIYDVYHSTNYDSDRSKAAFSFYKSTPFLKLLIYDDTLDPSEDHTFQVRVQSIYGFPGEFTQPETVYALPPDKLAGLKPKKDDSGASSMVLSKENILLVSLLVPGMIIILVLATSLSIYVVRHRRLQRSLLSYTSSRYDCRSNSATFNDLAEEEQPMIQCFSDDEPLIVA